MQKKKTGSSLRKFIRQITGTTMVFGGGSSAAFGEEQKTEERMIQYQKNILSKDRFNVSMIGRGIMGNNNVNNALKVPGVQFPISVATDFVD